MFCIYCGTQLPNHAKYCYQCGKPVETPGNPMDIPQQECPCEDGYSEVCEIVYVAVQEKKIGLFPKEKGRYEAIIDKDGDKQVLAASTVFDLDGLNLYGPQQKNSRHKEPLEALVSALKAEGWIQQTKPGFIWYNLKFERNR